jgi:hypothetical protein
MTSDRRDRFLNSMLDVLWAQWSAIGVAGVQAARASVVDPEALVVATAEFGRYDARLFDEMLDWLVVNSSVIDFVRLRRFMSRAPDDAKQILRAVAQFVGAQEKRHTWLVLAQEPGLAGTPKEVGNPEPLFLSGDSRASWGQVDQVFLMRGFTRNPPVLREMSQHPRAVSHPCLRFRARALVGVGARAETLTYLWTHDWAHGRLIAERAGYAKTPVAQYLSDLSAAELALRRAEGRRVRYRLGPELAVLGQGGSAYVDWASVLRGMAAIWHEIGSWKEGGEQEYAKLSRLAQVLADAQTDLGAEGFDINIPEIRGWARDGGDLPLLEIDRITEHLAKYAE